MIFSEEYIQKHYNDIMSHAGAIEQRMDDDCCTQEMLSHENKDNLKACRQYGCDYILIDGVYRVDIVL